MLCYFAGIGIILIIFVSLTRREANETNFSVHCFNFFNPFENILPFSLFLQREGRNSRELLRSLNGIIHTDFVESPDIRAYQCI